MARMPGTIDVNFQCAAFRCGVRAWPLGFGFVVAGGALPMPRTPQKKGYVQLKRGDKYNEKGHGA